MNCCDREIVETLPDIAYSIFCGGKECNHRKIYGLPEEDCRQVILISETIINKETYLGDYYDSIN